MEKKNKKPGRPVKYVYLDKFERKVSTIEDRLDAMANLFVAEQVKVRRMQWTLVAILCATILSVVLF